MASFWKSFEKFLFQWSKNYSCKHARTSTLQLFKSNFWRVFTFGPTGALPWHTAEATYVAATEQPLWSLERCWCWGCYLLLSYTVLSTSLEVDKQAASEKKQLEGGLRTSDTIECMKNSREKMASHSLQLLTFLVLNWDDFCLKVYRKFWNLLKWGNAALTKIDHIFKNKAVQKLKWS